MYPMSWFSSILEFLIMQKLTEFYGTQIILTFYQEPGFILSISEPS